MIKILNDKPSNLKAPVLALRDIVVFPGMVVPLFVGREKSITALEEVIRTGGEIILVTQKNGSVDEPKISELYDFGTSASVIQLLRLPDGTVKVLVEGIKRAKIREFNETQNYFEARYELIEKSDKFSDAIWDIARSVVNQFEEYVKLNKKIQPEIIKAVNKIKDLEALSDTVAAHLNVDISKKQDILRIIDLAKRLEELFSIMEEEIAVLNTEKSLRSRVKKQMEKSQRDYYLNEQLKAIQKELGDGDDIKNEIKEIEKKVKKLKLSKEAMEKVQTELKKLKSMTPMSAEATVVRNYLDWVISIPWKKKTKLSNDIKKSEKILDEDHYALKEVKERILEYLAVQQRTKALKGPILCLVGPPGVGKTSLARSIARATNRKFVKIALGGMRDESEIRGHRRTYIGSMPGRIIQSMKKARFSNPLMLLDEIDKMGHDHRGDPSSALLEVLDPQQNKHFNDHYLDIDYDLSDVMFITTANSVNMPRPLMDRMEIIRISGYTEDEKLSIAKEHLIAKQMKEHGLKKNEFSISDTAIVEIIRYYTKEAGVRAMEREIAKLARKCVKELISDSTDKKISITPKNLGKYLGVKKFKYNEAEKEHSIASTTGLAYTETGGDLLSIEAVLMPGKGKIQNTGKLGDVMKESIFAAHSYIRSRSVDYGIQPNSFQEEDIHIHVPEGATPKDGPSAGIAIATTIVSACTGIAVDKDIAMTGEITLRGKVLPIGGLKEKLLAALRGGIKKVLIPKDNVKDLEEIPENVKNNIEIIPVEHLDQVLKHSLVKKLKPIAEKDVILPGNENMEKHKDMVKH